MQSPLLKSLQRSQLLLRSRRPSDLGAGKLTLSLERGEDGAGAPCKPEAVVHLPFKPSSEKACQPCVGHALCYCIASKDSLVSMSGY